MITRANPHDNSVASVRSIASVRDVCRTLFRHKWKMALFFCTTLVLVLGGLSAYPRSYTSEARLFVRLGKESVSLDPTATLSQTLNVSVIEASDEIKSLERITKSDRQKGQRAWRRCLSTAAGIDHSAMSCAGSTSMISSSCSR